MIWVLGLTTHVLFNIWSIEVKVYVFCKTIITWEVITCIFKKTLEIKRVFLNLI
jgi:hypothetical protein